MWRLAGQSCQPLVPNSERSHPAQSHAINLWSSLLEIQVVQRHKWMYSHRDKVDYCTGRASRAYNCWCRTMPKCNLERVCDQTRIIIPHVTVSLPGFYYGHPAIEPKVPGISLHVVLNSGTMHTIKFHICQLCSSFRLQATHLANRPVWLY
jgi:hypothetical protein